MFERSIYDAVFNLLVSIAKVSSTFFITHLIFEKGAVREQPTSLHEVGTYYDEEVSDMVWEFSQLLRGWRALTLTYGFEERLFGIADSSGHEVPTQLPQEMYPYIWGNQVFLQSLTFTEYLAIAQQDRGLLTGIELPQRAVESYQSNMRKGNLRADGVI